MDYTYIELKGVNRMDLQEVRQYLEENKGNSDVSL